MAPALLAATLGTLLLTLPAVPPQAGDARIAGQVVEAESGIPLAGARVTLAMLAAAPDGASGSLQFVTDSSGEFTFERLAPGRYQLEVQRTGFAGYPDPLAPQLIEIAAGQASGRVQIALTRGAVIAGRIVDSRGEPLPEITVWALKTNGLPDRDTIATTQGGAQTNDLGEFRIASLTEGRYVVVAAPQPQSPVGRVNQTEATTLAPTYYPGTTDRQNAEPLALAAGQTLDGIQFTMASTAAFRISGIVVDSMEAPAPGTILVLIPESGQLGAALAFSPVMGFTQPDGTFQMNGVPSGVYRLVTMGWMTSLDAAGTAGSLATISAASERFDVALDPVSNASPGQRVIVENADLSDLKVVVASRR